MKNTLYTARGYYFYFINFTAKCSKVDLPCANI